MSKIVKLDPSYQLWLTYSWSGNNHGICGHLYEVIDYFWILRNHFTVGILLCEDIDWCMVEVAIRSKYDFTDDEIAEFKKHTIFHNRPRLLVGTNILFTDGGVINTSSVVMYFDNILYFACGNRCIKNNNKPNVWVLQDDRVYDAVALNGIDYKKRILFDRLKPIGHSDDALLAYVTRNCREFTQLEELLQYGKPIIAVTNDIPTAQSTSTNITFITPPVPDIFSKFSTYVYTPIQRKFDCSPRFIAECRYYGKEVIYHNIDYWDVDTGLYWRKWDIDNNFDDLYLTQSDPIIDILRRII